ncbi:hypothetical protein AB0M29_41775 [Streptomyces sp. NPDC051976]
MAKIVNGALGCQRLVNLEVRITPIRKANSANVDMGQGGFTVDSSAA